MSILKGILHHWNKTTKSYDTIHPETEVAQVTDWNEGIVATMASTALSGLVKTLSSDSLLTLLIKKVFEATGVKYSLGQNGYVCWGSLFGGVITQWGREATTTGSSRVVALPIAYDEGLRVFACDTGAATVTYGAAFKTTTSIEIFSSQPTWECAAQYFVIAKA
ncbi:hypothetical protein ACE418_09475 [Megasphaera sp. WILCCON 0056]|uniref:gp53-like domain-containing protein n=1 Tax=Megasphaera sp. WILCCON 0056 TaxID=3345340 RepID=UPI003A811230